MAVVNGVVTDVLFDPINMGRAYAGQNGVGVLKSSDGGQTYGGQTWLGRQGSRVNLGGHPKPASCGQLKTGQ
jgi:hypothetical protein